MTDECYGDEYRRALAERIKACAQKAGGKNELIRRSGVASRNYGRWTIAKNLPKVSELVRIAKCAGVSMCWLATGRECGVTDYGLLRDCIAFADMYRSGGVAMTSGELAHVSIWIYSHAIAQPDTRPDPVTMMMWMSEALEHLRRRGADGER